jgi:hypothetical protein
MATARPQKNVCFGSKATPGIDRTTSALAPGTDIGDGQHLKFARRAAERQTAMKALLLVVERNGLTMFARIGMMRALHRHRPEPTPAPRRKSVKAFQIIAALARTC